MHDEPSPSAPEREAMQDSTILEMLISEDGPWSAQEIDREVGFDPTDSLRRLYGAGLLHRVKRFYWPTRAAIYAEQIKT